MVTIKSINDLNKITNQPYLIRDYLFHYLNELLTEYKCTNISSVGAFYLLECIDDSYNTKTLGLAEGLDKRVPEFTQIITIKDNKNEVDLIHSCFVINNDYAISVFTKANNLDNKALINLLSDYTRKEVTIDVQER